MLAEVLPVVLFSGEGGAEPGADLQVPGAGAPAASTTLVISQPAGRSIRCQVSQTDATFR